MNRDLHSIKRETIASIVYELCKISKLTKKQLAERCSVTTATVSAVISGLADMGLISETYTDAKKGTRRSKAYYMHVTNYACIIDISNKIFKLYVCRSYRHIKTLLTYDYDPKRTFENNLQIFTRLMNHALKNFNEKRCAGRYILLSGTPCSDGVSITDPIIPETNNYSFSNILNLLSPTSKRFYNDMRRLKSMYIQNNYISGDDLAFVMYMDKHRISSCIISSAAKNTELSNIGVNLKIGDTTMGSKLTEYWEPEDVIEEITSVIMNTYAAVPFSHLCITGDYIPSMHILIDLIYKRIHKDQPHIRFIPLIDEKNMLEELGARMLCDYFMNIILDKKVDKQQNSVIM